MKAKKIAIIIIAVILLIAIVASSLIVLIPLFKKDDKDKDDNSENSGYSLNDNVTVIASEEYKKLEKATISHEQTQNGMKLTLSDDSVFEDLSKNDIFVLNGGAESIFGQAYFGKIKDVDKVGDTYVYDIVTPYIDEVLLDAEIDTNVALGYDNIETFAALDGVSISNKIPDGYVYEDLNKVSPVTQLSANNNLNYSSVPLAKGITPVVGDNIVLLDINIDILELLRKRDTYFSDEDDYENSEIVDTEEEADLIFVYYTDTGLCYHELSCHCLAKSMYRMPLKIAKEAMGLRPCKICKPPIYDDSYYSKDDGDSDILPDKENNSTKNPISTSSELKLTGKVILKDISLNLTGKGGKAWKLKNGFDNLAVNVGGVFHANAKLEGNFNMDIKGDTTRLVLWGDENNPDMYIEGLEEKLLPLAFISYNGGTVSVKMGNGVDDLQAPFTVGIMLYTDLQGNITACTEVFCSYTYSLNYKFNVFEKGKFVATKNKFSDAETKKDFDYGFKAEAKASVDFQFIGASAMLYLGNMNVMELGLVTAGAEAEGTITLDSEKYEQGENLLTADASALIYIEMLDLKFRLKYHSWDEALAADPEPLLRFVLAEFKYSSEDGKNEDNENEDDNVDTPEPDETGALEYELRSYEVPNFNAPPTIVNYYAVTGIGSYTGEDLVIPSTYKGLDVREIAPYAFDGCTSIKTLEILSKSTYTIGEYAFRGCSSLEEIEISEDVMTIERGAFLGCTSLSTFKTFNSPVVEEEVFAHCSSLRTIYVTNIIYMVETNAFLDCVSLENVYFNGTPDELDSISIFVGNDALFEAEIITIRDDANESYDYDPETRTLTVYGNGDIPDYYIDGGDVPPWEDLLFNEDFECVVSHVIISDGITRIGTESFAMGDFETVTIPKSVNIINHSVFGSVETVYYKGSEADWNKIQIGGFNDNLLSANIIFLG